MNKYLFSLAACATAAIAFVACTTTTNVTSPSKSGGPAIAADQVGSACSGVGTSPGDVAVFTDPTCPAGLCIADARTDFDTYCSAGCDGRTCPDGFDCIDATFGDTKKVCLKNGSPTTSDSDAGVDGAASGPIGTKTTTGVKSVDVNISSHTSWDCDTECTKAGGKCNGALASKLAMGLGWVERKYNDDSGTTGDQISSCDEEQDYVSFNTTMTSMSCECDGMTIPTTVTVTKAQGLASCNAVCTSWSLKCNSTDRHSYAYADVEEEQSTLLDSCDAIPSGKIDHEVCACDP